MARGHYRRQGFRWQYLPMAVLVFAATWLSTGLVAAVMAAAAGLAIGILAKYVAQRRGIERIHVPARYAVAGTLAVLIAGTAIVHALR